MTLETALYATQVLLAFAYIQQSAEHLATPAGGRPLFLFRILFSIGVLSGIQPLLFLAGLAVISLLMLHRFQGPYNGGSDRLSVLILWCLLGVELVPKGFWKEVLFAYLAFQLTLSYFMSGKVKLTNPEWRSGRALQDVFEFSAYPVAENLRGLARRTGLMKTASWLVIGFEVAFPLALLHPMMLGVALGIGACFHLANACLFGLNRFLWIWLAAYPSLLWFQHRVMGG